MAELQVGQLVWILIRLKGVVLDHDTEEANDPYSGNRIGLAASLDQLYNALNPGGHGVKVRQRSWIMAKQPKEEAWNPRPDLAIGQKVEADFSFAFTIVWTPRVSLNDPEEEYGILAINLDTLRMQRLYSVGELMPGQRVHKLPQAAQP